MKSSIALYQALKSINVSDERAKSVADALEADMETHLATKADIKELELATKADIKALASDIKALELATKADIKALEQSTKADIKALEQSTKADIKALALDTKARFDLLDVQLQYLVQIMKWGMGIIGVAVLIPITKQFVESMLQLIGH